MLDFQLAERVVALEQQVSWLTAAVLCGFGSIAIAALVILFTGRK